MVDHTFIRAVVTVSLAQSHFAPCAAICDLIVDADDPHKHTHTSHQNAMNRSDQFLVSLWIVRRNAHVSE